MSSSARAEPQPYSDPYLTGIALGLVLLAAFVLVGRGLGASGAFATAAASAVNAASSSAARNNSFFADHATPGGPFGDWLVIELLGRPNGVGFAINFYFVQSLNVAAIVGYSVVFMSVMIAIDILILQRLEAHVRRWR